ncbi:MAG TPA: CinA family nicotinamide mononucleotide deamidase-related protein [Spongiibacteraceae bacterium]|nr:CinA family nicotinamide mononucleotide deamidase-related protein [Spongiibacteraceae bacterium]
MILNLLLTGNELMTGDTVDSNSAMIARYVAAHGWHVRKKLTVGDDLNELIAALQLLTRDCDVLLVNGGLGPTIDDLTAQALATACAVSLTENPTALQHLEQWCGRIGIAINAANRKQAILPAGCAIVANPIGSAVGFAMQLNNCRVICTPGVPRELDAMLAQEIMPMLQRDFPSSGASVQRFTLFGIGESALQQKISDAIPDWPADVELGFRVSFPQLELKLSTASAQARSSVEKIWPRLEAIIGAVLLGEGDITLPQLIVDLLRQRGKKLTLAESCTGGLIAASITQIPGASAVFDAGFVTYSNAMKQTMLGVDEQSLQDEGAVSESVVRAMALGALQRSCADYAIAVSGIAGPDGGTPEKPVGTVWLAWGSADNLKTKRLHVRFKRLEFQKYVAWAGLDLIRRELLGIAAEPTFFGDRR